MKTKRCRPIKTGKKCDINRMLIYEKTIENVMAYTLEFGCT